MNTRLHIDVYGLVQGIGWRPFIYHLALEHRLGGWVSNSLSGSKIELEGPTQNIEAFLKQLKIQPPPLAVINKQVQYSITPQGETEFHIIASINTGSPQTSVPKDIAICKHCQQELHDPSNRRYRYPFITCNHCGPRFSIIDQLPFDRTNTSMAAFPLCQRCNTEYHDPKNRRFHSQTLSCPDCGPTLSLWGHEKQIELTQLEIITHIIAILKTGGIVALKGIGGYELLVNANQPQAIERLRAWKPRPNKPLTVMVKNYAAAKKHCEISNAERALLESPIAPIVLLKKARNYQKQSDICQQVSAGFDTLGVMLPASALHHILLTDIKTPIVITSGNRYNQPPHIDDIQAIDELSDIADVCLAHNRQIMHMVDDSVVRIINEQPCILRLARGYAPLELTHTDNENDYIALGTHNKNSFALACQKKIILSQHIGNLKSTAAQKRLKQEIQAYLRLYQAHPLVAACDMHSNYQSSRLARKYAQDLFAVQHHAAHLYALQTEHQITTPCLAVTFNDTGLGIDHTIWGGEFLAYYDEQCERIANILPFRLPGGEMAIKQPRRSAFGVLSALYQQKTTEHPWIKTHFSTQERHLITTALEKKLNTPVTTSIGRLFDAVAALLDIIYIADFDDQALMLLESLAAHWLAQNRTKPYTIDITSAKIGHQWDWRPVVLQILEEKAQKKPPAYLAARFHLTLAHMIAEMAQKSQQKTVLLTGSVFQNALLTALTVRQLKASNFTVYTHHKIPPNDSSIALGQIMACVRQNISQEASLCV